MPPFEDARKQRSKGGGGRFDPAKHPRGAGGRFVSTGDRLRNVLAKAGSKPEVEAKFGRLRSPALTSKVIKADVRGFNHSISSDAARHMQRRHPYLTERDFARLPAIVRAKPVSGTDRGPNGEPRVLYRATIDGVRYGYVAEYRRRKRRLAAVTLYIE